MLRMIFIAVLVLFCPLPVLRAYDHSWSLDSLRTSELSVHGDIAAAAGVEGNSAVLDGASLLKVKDSERLASGEGGFALTAWVNPYLLGKQQQMIAAKNRYSLDERQWGVMIDKDNRFRLYVWQGKWATAEAKSTPRPGHWYLIGVVVRPTDVELWVNGKREGQVKLTKPIPQTKAPITFGGVDDNGRIWQNFSGALDEIHLFDKPLDARQMATAYKPVTATHKVPEQSQPITLWTGPPIPSNVEKIPFAEGIEHRTIHRPTEDGNKFLHGAAIVEHKGVLYANWANSPVNENGPHETLQGRRSTDGGVTWSELEIIGPGFEGPDRHSHGVLFVHKGELWTICARFGVGTPGRRFPGLQGEAFVLDEQTDRWKSRGIVMQNCWPYDEPVRMTNGNFITGGQDKDGLPVVAISHGDDLTKWDSVLIPYDRRLQPSFAETTVSSEGDRVIAVIRGGGGVAWASTSDDFGRTWSKAGPTNLPMPRAKAYLGKLRNGQLYFISNLKNRDTLVVSVSRPGESTLSSMWQIRHGKSDAPRFPGRAKSKQWSYPYGYEHDGKLYIVYSVGKEECGLTTVPVESLAPRPPFELWNGPALPKASEAEVLENVPFHVIKKWEPEVDGYRWLHGVGLAWHKGKLYASFGHNKGRENTVTEEGRFCVSSDGGKTWSDIRTMDVGSESDNLAVSHGVFLSHGDKLWAFLGAFYDSRQRVHTRAYTLDESTGKWQPHGVIVQDGFWPMTEPVKMADGNWILSGFLVGDGNPAAVAISEGDDLMQWNLVVIPRDPRVGRMWGESSLVVAGSRILNIARYGQAAKALVATSDDFGKTWTPTVESNMPMAGAKPCAGVLSTGQRYLVCSTTADGGHRRYPLTIAVSRPREETFSKVFVIRHAVFPDGPGESHPSASLSYPYAIEHDGKLYVGYSNAGGRGGNHNSAELAVIPVASLHVK